ncbi:MAG: CYTH domain-containing protein [Lachnospiraceae bacterium]|nr:CYTH domain-containing protein [Lachnospiraceae bacterium]MCR5634178.1 CYTH domain-containing protein [Lachnospiraceae bacterium]
MKNVEIERKYLIKKLPDNLAEYESHLIEQAYLCTDPTIRVRKSDDDYYMTYKGRGLLERTEYNLPLNKDAYEKLVKKAEGNIISKRRYVIPIDGSDLKIELDVFDDPFAPLIMAEVEFGSVEESEGFIPPDWFDKEVTEDPAYHNSNMAMRKIQ